MGSEWGKLQEIEGWKAEAELLFLLLQFFMFTNDSLSVSVHVCVLSLWQSLFIKVVVPLIFWMWSCCWIANWLEVMFVQLAS